jgi:hypothetical protein
MGSVAISLIPALADSERPDGDDRKIYVIVPLAQAYLADPLTKKLGGRGHVEVIVERRRAERRTERQVVSVDRRRVGRRRHHEGMVQVVIGTKDSRLGGPPEASS